MHQIHKFHLQSEVFVSLSLLLLSSFFPCCLCLSLVMPSCLLDVICLKTIEKHLSECSRFNSDVPYDLKHRLISCVPKATAMAVLICTVSTD